MQKISCAESPIKSLKIEALDVGVYNLVQYSGDNCTLISNSAVTYGGGSYKDRLLYNCMLIGNSCAGGTAGAAHEGLHYNCTIVGNSAKTAGGVHQSANSNCIIYFNYADTGSNWYDTAKTVFSNSCTIPTTTVWTVGNITNDPMFIANGNGYGTNHTAGNYRLSKDSPCINTGINQDWMTNAKDLDGQHSRIDRFSGIVDMGCYEYLPSGTMCGIR